MWNHRVSCNASEAESLKCSLVFVTPTCRSGSNFIKVRMNDISSKFDTLTNGRTGQHTEEQKVHLETLIKRLEICRYHGYMYT